MADYDYKAGKQRLEEILDNDMEVPPNTLLYLNH